MITGPWLESNSRHQLENNVCHWMAKSLRALYSCRIMLFHSFFLQTNWQRLQKSSTWISNFDVYTSFCVRYQMFYSLSRFKWGVFVSLGGRCTLHSKNTPYLNSVTAVLLWRIRKVSAVTGTTEKDRGKKMQHRRHVRASTRRWLVQQIILCEGGVPRITWHLYNVIA